MNYNPYNLKGKTILITGASSGIGRATAVECSKLGATCVLSGRDKTRLTETYQALEGENHSIIIADLQKEEDVLSIAEQTPMLDGFVCNAGGGYMAPIPFVDSKKMQQIFSINTMSPILLTKALMSKRKLKKGCAIVFTSSTDAFRPAVANSVYAASKGALTTFMRSCAKEFAQYAIRANAVMPGMIDTPFICNEYITEEDLHKDTEACPLKRYGRPEEVSWAIIYLLSDAAAWVTGSVLTIDGGCSIR